MPPACTFPMQCTAASVLNLCHRSRLHIRLRTELTMHLSFVRTQQRDPFSVLSGEIAAALNSSEVRLQNQRTLTCSIARQCCQCYRVATVAAATSRWPDLELIYSLKQARNAAMIPVFLYFLPLVPWPPG